MSSYFKRALVCFVCMLTAMLLSGAALIKVAIDPELSQAAANQSTRRVDVVQHRGLIYDCNGERLTDRSYSQASVIFPTDKASVLLSKLQSGQELVGSLQRVRQGQAVTVKGVPNTDGGWQSFFVPQRYSGSLCHVLGYLDSDGHGVTGIEKYYDDVLFTERYSGVSYTVDSLGRMLEGVPPVVYNEAVLDSVTLTVDSKIQTIAEQALGDVESGAIVVLEAKTGKIKAIAGAPTFDPENVGEALTDEGSPLINRATYSYNVGSVFKPCIAVAALENGLADYRYICTGSITVGDKTFKCNNRTGHGELDLKEALAHSCNTYFYTLAERLGAEAVYDTAKVFRFGEQLNCNGGLVSNSGSVPTLEKLLSLPAELTNLSIGQGDLMLSPIAIAVMYSAVVNGGQYRLPYIVERFEKDKKVTDFEPSSPTVAFSKETASVLKEYLKYALQNGTGSAAYSEGISTGGKTGTAQTGWRDGDRNILNGWFCGFYEGQASDYVVVILKEDVKSGSTDCAPIFKTVTERMHKFGF